LKQRVAILISGGGSNMQALVRSMQGDHPAMPVLVLSNSPDSGGIAKAQALNVPTAIVDHRAFGKDRAAFEAALQRELAQANPDIICLAGFMRVLSPEFVTKWQGKILNIHPSLLPKYPGLHTHERALSAAASEHGATVHLVTPDLDAGPILGQIRFAIQKGDTPDTLATRLLPLEHRLYTETLRRFAAGDITRQDIKA
jgi:phosphoribosylglycinamide formyltransferase 1